MNIVILGAPGSGKGTQARVLSKLLDIEFIDFGSLLRKKASLDPSIKKVIDSGLLLPDNVVGAFLREEIVSLQSDFILDGFPRTLGQAKFLNNFLFFRNMKIDFILKLNIADNVLLKRLSNRFSCTSCGAVYSDGSVMNCTDCGDALVKRDDDEAEIVKLRLKKYYKNSGEIADFYGDAVLNVNGDGGIEYVTKKIISKIGFKDLIL